GIRDFHVTGVQTCALPIYICTLEEELGSVPCEGGDCSSPSPVDPGTTSVAPGNPTPPVPNGECAFLAELTSENGRCLQQDARCRSEERRVGQRIVDGYWLK